jgi:hypothetical protein
MHVPTTSSSWKILGAKRSTSASHGWTITAPAIASSRIGIVDRSAEPGGRKVVGQFFSQGREAHGLWTNPDGTRIYIAHEQDELPNTPNGGQTVCSVFDVSDPFKPQFITQIALGDLTLPSGKLRNKKSINLVYVRPGTRGQAG